MAIAKATVHSVAKPVFDALATARDPKSPSGAKLSHTEALKLIKAMDDAIGVGLKKLGPPDAFEKLPRAIGLGVLKATTRKDFASVADMKKVRITAADIAGQPEELANA